MSANLQVNKFKNRLVNILPFESSRVCLQPMRGIEGSDYINASFIDGYRLVTNKRAGWFAFRQREASGVCLQPMRGLWCLLAANERPLGVCWQPMRGSSVCWQPMRGSSVCWQPMRGSSVYWQKIRGSSVCLQPIRGLLAANERFLVSAVSI